jgi:capsular polysaccharide biosynthesis protein
MPEFAAEFLDLLGIPEQRVATEFIAPTVFRSAIFTTPINLFADVLNYENVFFALREAVLAGADKTNASAYNERIWLARGIKAVNGRHIVNVEEVTKILSEFDFQVVDMGTMSAHQQVAVASRAECLAGAHGAAFVHSMFLAADSTVIECFSPEYVHPCVLGICRHLNHGYFQLVYDNFVKYPYSHDVMIDCSHLELVLRKLPRKGKRRTRINLGFDAFSRLGRAWSSKRTPRPIEGVAKRRLTSE